MPSLSTMAAQHQKMARGEGGERAKSRGKREEQRHSNKVQQREAELLEPCSSFTAESSSAM